MNKKAYALTAVIIITILVISLALLLFIFFAPEGSLDKAADIGDELSDRFLPKRESKMFATEVEKEDAISESFSSMLSVFQAGSQSDLTECVWHYITPPQLDQYNIRITQKYDENNDASGAFFELINTKGQIIDTATVPNIILCAVGGNAGQYMPTEKFFKRYLVSKSADDSVNKSETIIEGTSITIYEPFVGTKEKFQFTTKAGKKYSGWKLDYNGATLADNKVNILFQLDKTHICFIPTTNTGKYSEKGVEDDHIKNIKEYALDDCSKGSLTSADDSGARELIYLADEIKNYCVDTLQYTEDARCSCEMITELNLKDNDIKFEIRYGNLELTSHDYQGNKLFGPIRFDNFDNLCMYGGTTKTSVGNNLYLAESASGKLIASYGEKKIEKMEVNNPLRFYIDGAGRSFCIMTKDAEIADTCY